MSRNENDVSVSFPELQGLADRDLLLDGEVVAFDQNDGGRPSFARLAERMHVANAKRAAALVEVTPVTFLVFDLLRLDGRDLSSRPLSERRELLESLGLADVHWQVPAVYDDGAMLMQATEQQGLEGVVSKRRSSRYEFGVRTRHWLKFPHRRRTSWVVGGWRLETDSTSRLGAVLVGEPTLDGGLLYRGRVGSGITGKVGVMLRELLEPRSRGTSPFSDEVPRLDALGTRWVDPVLVVDVESLGFSRQAPAPPAVVSWPAHRSHARRPQGASVKRILLVCLLTLTSVVTLTLLGPVPADAATTVTLGGVKVRLHDGTTQVVTVNHTKGYRARIVLWRKTDDGWDRKLRRQGPDRVRRSRRRQQAQAGHRHHAAGHLRPDLQLRYPPA